MLWGISSLTYHGADFLISCIAELNSTRPGNALALLVFGIPADCKSAIQQIRNLRYVIVLPPKCTTPSRRRGRVGRSGADRWRNLVARQLYFKASTPGDKSALTFTSCDSVHSFWIDCEQCG